MATARVERRLAAILAADVVGYSRLMERDEDRTLARLKALRTELVEPLIAEYQGRVVKLMGDGLLAEFASVVDAVRCAVLVQRGATEREAEVAEDQRIRLRIGVNLGDVVREADGDLYGDGVNVAARLEQACEPGGVMVSGTAYDHLQGKLDFPLEFAGEQRVKNIERLVRAYRVRMDGTAARVRVPSRRVRRLVVPAAAALLLLLALAAGGAWWLWPGEIAAGKPSVAVLPFDNYGGDEATAGRLADGITEDTITDLARFRSLDVIARNSTEAYKGKPVDVRQIGRDLRVGYVLEGSVQRQADRVRVTAQLIDVRSGAHVWSERWDRPTGDVFAVQSELAEAVADKIGGYYSGTLVGAGQEAAKRKRPRDLTAYDLYLLGMEAKHRGTKEAMEEGAALLRRSLAADPTLARAWTGLFWALYGLSGYIDETPEALKGARGRRPPGGRAGPRGRGGPGGAGHGVRRRGRPRPRRGRVRQGPAAEPELGRPARDLRRLGVPLRQARGGRRGGRAGDAAEPEHAAVGLQQLRPRVFLGGTTTRRRCGCPTACRGRPASGTTSSTAPRPWAVWGGRRRPARRWPRRWPTSRA